MSACTGLKCRNARPAPVAVLAEASPEASVLQVEAQAMLDQLSQQTEEIMVTVDVPYVPAQYTQVVAQAESAHLSPEVITLAQAAGSEKALQGCRDVETIVKDSAINEFNPSYVVFKHLGYQVKNGDYNAPQAVKDSVKTSLLKSPAHGKLVPQSFNFWTYEGEDNYQGTDQATFLVEVSGKRYKVVINYLVHEVVDQNANPPACESVFPPSTTPSRGMTIEKRGRIYLLAPPTQTSLANI